MSRIIERPLTVVGVRHAQSVANLAQLADKAGDSSLYTKEFKQKPNYLAELTEEGEKQAKITGQWIRENINGGEFDRYYVSTLYRAEQTALLLNLPKAVWEIKSALREQSWGWGDGIPREELYAMYPGLKAMREKDPFNTRWPGGDSLGDMEFIFRYGIADTIHREVSERTFI